MKTICVSLIVSALILGGCTKTPDPICQQLEISIDENIKRIALTLAEGELSDKGAMQQAARYTMANNHLQVIRLNIDLQAQHSCPIRKAVIDPFVFQSHAMKCIAAKLGAQNQETLNLCYLKNWKPG